MEGKCLIVSVYVDDLIFTGNNVKMFERFKNSMKQEFDMSDLGRMKYFLGVEVVQHSEGIFINQRKYANEVLERFRMRNCNLVKNPIIPGFKLVKDEGEVSVDATTYKQMVGSLMYLTATRPDLAFVVSLISKFMERPTELHQQAVKRVLRYIKGQLSWESLTKKVKKRNWQPTRTATMQEILKTGKAHQDMHSCSVQVLSHGLQRNNQ